MIAPCRLDGRHCLDCRRTHFGKALEYSQGADERSQAIRKLWRYGQGGAISQSPPKPLLRSLPLAKMCGNNTGENGTAKAGCATCTTYGCKVKGTVRVSECVYCEDWKPAAVPTVPATTAGHHLETPASIARISWPPNTTIRHLLYHIYPVSNGHWRWNVEQLCGRLKAFNGHRIVAIVTDPPTGRLPDPGGSHPPDRARHIPGCDSAEEVKAEFGRRWSGEPITFIELDNDPSLREVKSFIPMLEYVLTDDPNHITLYAQAKGTTRHNGHIARRWTETLYEIMFDHFPLAEEMLKDFPVVGCFKKLGPGWSPEQSHSDWHWSGSWAFFRNADLAKKEWWKIDAFWSGVEPYWSQHFRCDEAKCMFHEAAVPVMNLYSTAYWRRVVIPAFNQWRKENAKWRTTMWPK